MLIWFINKVYGNNKLGGRVMIEVKNVTQKYKKTIAVKNINFTIKKGEIIGILGPKGAGKSTILDILTGYLQPTEGKIEIKDKSKIIIGYMP